MKKKCSKKMQPFSDGRKNVDYFLLTIGLLLGTLGLYCSLNMFEYWTNDWSNNSTHINHVYLISFLVSGFPLPLILAVLILPYPVKGNKLGEAFIISFMVLLFYCVFLPIIEFEGKDKIFSRLIIWFAGYSNVFFILSFLVLIVSRLTIKVTGNKLFSYKTY